MRSKPILLSGIALLGALCLFSATQVWLDVSFGAGVAAFGWLEITGQQVNQSLSPIAIASLASVLALTIAGRGFRMFLGVLIALLGAGIAAISAVVLRNPEGATLSRVAEATGLTGSSQLDSVTGVEVSPLIFSTLVAGVLMGILGVLVVLLGRKWKKAGRKYETDRAAQGASTGEPDRITDWETMNAGDDPSDAGGEYPGDEPQK